MSYSIALTSKVMRLALLKVGDVDVTTLDMGILQLQRLCAWLQILEVHEQRHLEKYIKHRSPEHRAVLRLAPYKRPSCASALNKHPRRTRPGNQ